MRLIKYRSPDFRIDMMDAGLNEQEIVPPISPRFYSDSSLVPEETERVFTRNWISIGRSDLVVKPGDYKTIDILGYALILIRDRSGILHAYANSCRHRGARLLEGLMPLHAPLALSGVEKLSTSQIQCEL
jgi:hypothetical protein